MSKRTGIILSSLVTATAAYSSDNALFQDLDNQIAIGYNYSSSTSTNPNFNNISYTTQSNNLAMHLEQLFNNNVWWAADGNFMFKGSQSGPGGDAFSLNLQTFAMPAAISGKFGYSFNQASSDIQVIPYASLGRALNYNGVAIAQNGFGSSYYNYYGGGGRIEYVFTPRASIYFDQGIGYLSDPNQGKYNQDAMSYTSILGMRFNVASQFQIAAQGSYNFINTLNQSLGYDPVTFYHQNTQQNSYGATLYFAYLFDRESEETSSRHKYNYVNPILADFDNSYTVGMGYAKSSNSYTGGNAPSINSTLNYFSFNVNHLFENHLWATINAQLINNLNQNNTPNTIASHYTPTYIGFPGALNSKIGYGFALQHSAVQFIPYGNLGLIMNINSYNLPQNSGIMNALSQDMYLQYGIGGRVEYAITPLFMIYGDQLLAKMQDQSTLGINAWHATSTIGAKLNPGSVIQLGLKGYYDIINPTNQASSGTTSTGTYYAANQTTIGAELEFGIRY